MNIYAAERQTGKTTMLVKESAKTGAIIVAPNRQMGSYIVGLADRLGVDIPAPITVKQYFQVLASGNFGNSQKYLVDELQMMLSQMGVKTATVSVRSVKLMSQSVKCIRTLLGTTSEWKWHKKSREG